MLKKRTLRSGYTTGACAAAAAKAATIQLMHAALGLKDYKKLRMVEIPFPDGSRIQFKVHNSGLITRDSELIARASVIKDAGDDPDVTNGAQIVAEARGLSLFTDGAKRSRRIGTVPGQAGWGDRVIIRGGKGVGRVTKPGLAVPVGEAAINPVPRKMITGAVMEGIQGFKGSRVQGIEIVISVPEGERLSKKTLNYRLGIEGGISILGTTGIVRPVSSEAWTAAIAASMDVAGAVGHEEIVLSAGRTSEKAHMKKFGLPEEAYVMMGDYLEFSLLEAKKHRFKKIHLCAQWAKMLKIAMATPQTNVRHGAIDIKKAKELLKGLGVRDLGFGQGFNTAREIFDFISSKLKTRNPELFSRVCDEAKKYAESVAGISVRAYLVSYEGDIISESE